MRSFFIDSLPTVYTMSNVHCSLKHIFLMNTHARLLVGVLVFGRFVIISLKARVFAFQCSFRSNCFYLVQILRNLLRKLRRDFFKKEVSAKDSKVRVSLLDK